jgi:hypothetical protein
MMVISLLLRDWKDQPEMLDRLDYLE